MKLNLGCGKDIRYGFINVDKDPKCAPDVLWDLNKFPYPFKDNSAGEILMLGALEHLYDTVKVMKELHRIAEPNCKLTITVPHYSGNEAWGNPDHKRAFTARSMYMFGNLGWFRVVSVKMRWKVKKYTSSVPIPLIKLLNALANMNHQFCEHLWVYWVGGFEEIEFKLGARKC